MLALRDGFSHTNPAHIWLSWISREPDLSWIWANTMLLSELISKRPQVFSSGLSHPLDWLYDSLSSPPVAGVWWAHTLDWLNDSLSSPPVAGVWWAHWCRCPVVAIALFKWMLHTGCGWGETPPHMIALGCTTTHNKALYKMHHSFNQSDDNRIFYINYYAFWYKDLDNIIRGPQRIVQNNKKGSAWPF